MTFEVAGDAYDRFMGRYSQPLAATFVDWLGVDPGTRAVDVGCGPGALTGVLVDRLGAERVAAADPTAPFVQVCRERHPGVDVRQAPAEDLPFGDDTFDLAAAGLVVHFMTDAVAGLTEMARVTRPGGWVAATVWDLHGRRAPMEPVWRGLEVVDPHRPDEGASAGARRGATDELMARAGLRDVESTELSVTVTHPTFEEWWDPYLHGVGPVGDAVAALDDEQRRRMESMLRDDLGDGPFELTAVAFAARGRV
ncbi:SAM-dependent methyltransferase [Nocardioides oleivorans]|uniref:SAM-dependent methyltransferase n=1 Tax=Nocardioides oleivorans TaxID=273676 RepID=A0A4Q2RTL4_9ACTN|nr:class I SAM-dependent methyltransferase [Nocardioides oleivorans]RYB91149.1 SAM-dependent methyltransferase [Nocardioides oleivorans]